MNTVRWERHLRSWSEMEKKISGYEMSALETEVRRPPAKTTYGGGRGREALSPGRTLTHTAANPGLCKALARGLRVPLLKKSPSRHSW